MIDKWLPIRKVCAAFVGAGIAWLALQVGVDLGPDAVNEAASAVVALMFAYVVRS